MTALVSERAPPEPTLAKACCAAAYGSEAARWLLGDSFHPGGQALTEHLGGLLGLTAGDRVLDLATGPGVSACFVAERFGCEVVGVDLSDRNVDAARQLARERGLPGRVTFEAADAEQLPFADESFDAVLCECAFCLFPDKGAAAREAARLLRPGGSFGMSDLVRQGELAPELQGLASWISCVADAQALQAYVQILGAAGLQAVVVERRDEALTDFAVAIRRRLLSAEILVGLGKLSWPNADFQTANAVADHALAAIRSGVLGYGLVVARREGSIGGPAVETASARANSPARLGQ